MKDDVSRFSDPRMAYYREVYLHSHRWQGESLTDKTLIVYMEQGIGDQIMFLRFFRFLKAPRIIVHADRGLERIIKAFGYEFLPKDETELPPHDFHVGSLSIPFLVDLKAIPVEPYVIIHTKKEVPEGWNVGIAWEGNPDHVNNKTRSCPLKHFKPLSQAGMKMYHLQPTIIDMDLIEGAQDAELYGIDQFNDWYDTAELINSVQCVITVDTGVLHLAGAMGKKTYALLGPGPHDPRWDQLWYPTVKFLRGSWEESIQEVMNLVKKPG